MAREFVMGARLQLADSFSAPLRFVRDNLTRTTQATNHYRDANGRLRNEMGRFVGAGRQVDSSLRQMAAAAMGARGRFVSLHGAMIAVASGFAVKKGFDWLVAGNADMETYQNTLSVVLKSQQKAADTLKWAQGFAANTPFEIPQVVEATTKLASYGMEAQRVLGVTGDMASVMGKSLDQAVEAIADAQTGELERLKEFGITKAMIEAQGAKLGAGSLVNKSGQITDQKAFNAALFSLMEERYKGGMELQSHTFKGMLSNASDFAGTMGRELGKPLFDKMKVGLQQMLTWAQKLKDSGQLQAWMGQVQRVAGIVWRVLVTVGGVIVRIFRESWNTASQIIGMVAGKMRAWYAEHAPQLRRIGQAFLDAFKQLQDAWTTYAVPTIDWLRNVGLPAVVDALAEVGSWVVNVATWFMDNWGWIQPFLIGLAATWGTYFVILKSIQGVMLLVRGATLAWAAAQTILNIAMNMNPVGLIITAVGLLIGAVILLVKNWDRVSAWLRQIWTRIWNTAVKLFTGMVDFFKRWGLTILAVLGGPIGILVLLIAKNWGKIKAGAAAAWAFVKDAAVGAWNGIVQGVSGMWTSIRDGFASGVNWIVGLVNKLIDKLNEALSIQLPEWMGGYSFALNLPHIPEMSMADGSHATGLGRVPFDGYNATLHEGEKVLTKTQSSRYDTALGFQQPKLAPQRPPVQIGKLVGQVVIQAAPGDDGEALYAKFIDTFHRKVKDAASILSTAELGAIL